MEEVNEKQCAFDTLERYSGSTINQFQPYIILTNFSAYVEEFARIHNTQIVKGSMFTVSHCNETKTTIIDCKLGSPAAALAIDICSFLPLTSILFLGMCGGLRRRYKVGEYLLPIAAIRGEGTSEYYFPKELPALANFKMQKIVSDELEAMNCAYHTGICFTSNLRFWEFNPEFIDRLKSTRAQAIEMECATLFIASYKRRVALGALLLVSDLPLNRSGIKSKESAEYVFSEYMNDHLLKAVAIINRAQRKA